MSYSRRRHRRDVWLCAILTLAVVLPRSLLIARSHSPSLDDDRHLDQGLAYLRGERHPEAYYDPALGKAILALPMLVAGCRVEQTWMYECIRPAGFRRTVLYNQRLDVQTLQMIEAAWKSLLFVPCVLIVFAWVQRLYGSRSAWLAVGIFLVEPSIAGHIPVAALDVLAMEAIVIASYLAWRYIDEPTSTRLIAACVATAAALMMKLTTVLLPAAFVALALIQWFVRPWIDGATTATLRALIRPRLNALAAATLITLAAMWPLSLFDLSAPAAERAITNLSYESGFTFRGSVLAPAMQVRWPCGMYFGALVAAFEHAQGGHSGYLWGETRENGWFYYFPAVALYKVPLGIWFVGGLGIVSLFLVRFTWKELSDVLPTLACAALLAMTRYNVGFRHALGVYALLLIFASRAAIAGRWMNLLAWLGVAATAVHTLTFHPDYISYTNGMTRRPYLAISDSNLDWDQGIKQVRRWLDAHPQPGRVVWFDIFGDVADPGIDHHLGGLIRRLCDKDPTPTTGLLIISPVRLVALYAAMDRWPHLRERDPDDMIGHCMLVYDLDAIAAESNDASRTTLPSKSGR